jgi:CBS domain containing-hemolysin-like protein
MARGELDQVLRHGHEAGILAAGQRSIAQRLFEVGNQSAILFGVPVDRLAIVSTPINVRLARNEARRHNHPMILVQNQSGIVGFLWYADLCSDDPDLEFQTVLNGHVEDRHLQVLLSLYDVGSEIAMLKDDQGKIRGVVTRRQLMQPLIK